MDVAGEIPLELCSLEKKYGDFTAVNKMSLAMKKGEIFGLLGPNGAGKTSIISCLVTLKEPTSGSCRIFGIDPSKDPLPAKMLTGYVPQEIVNHGYFTVEEIMEFHSGYFRVWNNREKIKYLLHRLSLWEHRKKKVKALSGGMKRRLLIAKSLVHEPKLLLLDEPTAGVDIELRNSLWEFVCELKKDGMSILLTTHYLEEAESLCDRVGVIQEGNLLTVGPTKDLIEKLTEREVILQFRSDFKGRLSSSYLIDSNSGEFRFLIPQKLGIGELLGSLDCNIKDIVDIRINEGSLEEAFVRILGQGRDS